MSVWQRQWTAWTYTKRGIDDCSLHRGVAQINKQPAAKHQVLALIVSGEVATAILLIGQLAIRLRSSAVCAFSI